jgi:hypothetical protein
MTARKLTGFEVGDIVTRDGTDRQRVIEVDDDGMCMEVECIQAPAPYSEGEKPWCEVGEREHNLQRRYTYADDAVDALMRRSDVGSMLLGSLASSMTLGYDEFCATMPPLLPEVKLVPAETVQPGDRVRVSEVDGKLHKAIPGDKNTFTVPPTAVIEDGVLKIPTWPPKKVRFR